MLNGDFLKTIEELHYNRGVPITEIARELGYPREYIHQLRSSKKRVTPEMLKRAEIVFPELLSKYPPLRGSPKFREEVYPFHGKKEREKSLIATIEKNRIRREMLNGSFWAKKEGKSEPFDNREMRLRIKEERGTGVGKRESPLRMAS
jgi:hypothetical protein